MDNDRPEINGKEDYSDAEKNLHLAWTSAVELIKAHSDCISAVDTKAMGVVAASLTTFGIFANELFPMALDARTALLSLGVIALVAAIILSVVTLYSRELSWFPSPKVIADNEKSAHIDVLRQLSKDMSDACDANKETIKQKNIYLKHGFCLLVIGVILSVIGAFV